MEYTSSVFARGEVEQLKGPIVTLRQRKREKERKRGERKTHVWWKNNLYGGVSCWKRFIKHLSVASIYKVERILFYFILRFSQRWISGCFLNISGERLRVYFFSHFFLLRRAISVFARVINLKRCRWIATSTSWYKWHNVLWFSFCDKSNSRYGSVCKGVRVYVQACA